MNKTELIEKVASKAGVDRNSTSRVIDAFTDAVSDALKRNDTVTLVGFGSFMIAKRSARTGRNPRTGEVIEIPETKVPKFKPGKTLKDDINAS